MKGALEADAFVNAARELLNQNDAIGAERILSPVIHQFRADAPVQHLMGQIKKTQGQLVEAERYFRAAIAHDLKSGQYYNELGLILQARGAHEDAIKVFRAAAALSPGLLMVRVNIVRCLMALNELGDAEREAREYVAIAPGAESLTLLGTVQRAQERHQDALITAETALKYGPSLRGLRYNYATALEKVGRTGEALGIFEKLTRQELDTPDLALHFARALYAAGRKKDAEEVVAKGVELWPQVSALHGVLSRIRQLGGAGENSVFDIEKAIAAHPTDLTLRLTCADALHRGGFNAKACNVLDEALRLAPEAPALLTAMGIVLDELDRPLDGLRVLRRAAEIAPSRTAQRNLLSTLLRAGQPEEVLRIVNDLRVEQPDEQYLIACATTAMRMLDHPEYRIWCDYDRMVRTYEIPPPHGFFTTEAFNAGLAALLRTQHKTNAHPLDQYIPNGSQTSRSLLALDEPAIKHFLAAMDVAVRDYVGRLRENDPVGARRAKHSRYSGLWSVRLGDGGYQPNHVHDRGWISSAYFVSVIPGERPKDPRAGWLKFGEPNRPIAKCGPEKLVEPEPGTLVLFPSYMWHGTVPFEGAERLSLAFDLIPG
ncbi:MAG: tetratricopeptide repeat protein [Hyphomonadaceae bacterium]|nr:tetratricopeptide repeat protein [Hyphomonadaceae bacterium]